MPVTVPCNQCIGCRLEYSRQWAVRCTHEASLWEHNCFITLTYDPKFLPPGGTLVKNHFQGFMKRFRNYRIKEKLDELKLPLGPIVSRKGMANYYGFRTYNAFLAYVLDRFNLVLRYYHCGEYGEKLGRPHYHACIFNFDFPDKIFTEKRNGFPVFKSELLEKLWGKGRCELGTVTFQSAAYVARYITKKINGPGSELKYMDIDYSSGEILAQRIPEYTTMSRRPGIAKKWFEKYHKDVFPKDFVTIGGKRIKPPKFYDSQYELLSPDELQKIKALRKIKSKDSEWNNTHERLMVRETIQKYKFSLLKRGYENDA